LSATHATHSPADLRPVWLHAYACYLEGRLHSGAGGRGQRVYEGYCAVCHNQSLGGLSGAFRGSGFVREWRDDNLENLFVRIRKTMPAENPSSLSEREYLDVLTYILSENGFPSGARELGFESLERIAIVDREGPKALPEGATVQTLGCLAGDPSAGTWTLKNAVAFVRTRTLLDAGKEETERFSRQRLGSQTVVLKTDTFRRFPPRLVQLTNQNGHKVIVRGKLERAGSMPGLMLLSVQGISQACP
jgi:hypothetical protein